MGPSLARAGVERRPLVRAAVVRQAFPPERRHLMPPHERNEVRDKLSEPLFARSDIATALPKYAFPMTETDAQTVYQVVADELLLDGNARQNLATFCQTWEEPQVHALMELAIDKNMIDKDEYPQTAELERRCVH